MKNEDKPCNCVNCNLARVVNDLLNMDQRKPSKPKLSENQIREAMGMRNALAGQSAGGDVELSPLIEKTWERFADELNKRDSMNDIKSSDEIKINISQPVPKPGDTIRVESLTSEPSKQDVIENTTGLKGQIGGDYYKTLAIQPVEYCYRNNIPAIESAVIKYVTRHRAKGGAKDIKKAIHLLTVLLELEYKC
jgi:hypothetical protein